MIGLHYTRYAMREGEGIHDISNVPYNSLVVSITLYDVIHRRFNIAIEPKSKFMYSRLFLYFALLDSYNDMYMNIPRSFVVKRKEREKERENCLTITFTNVWRTLLDSDENVITWRSLRNLWGSIV